LNERTVDKVPGARVNPWSLVKDPIYGRSAHAGRLCYFIDRRARLGPHCSRKSTTTSQDLHLAS
jgi:hypothetical protein